MIALSAPDANLTNLADAQPPLPVSLAMLHGQPLMEMPRDLYIPPDALEVILEAFEGPLDLLLYLIRRQNLDVMDIPVADITRQYVSYINLMQVLKLELAADYLVMAAQLAEIKSRMLLPLPATVDVIDDDGTFNDDPRAELVRRLQEYEHFRLAAETLDALPRLERDTEVARIYPNEGVSTRAQPEVTLTDMLAVLAASLKRSELQAGHRITRDALSVRERMTRILQLVADGEWHDFERFFLASEGRQGIVVTLLAILELTKEQLIQLRQDAPTSAIHIQCLPQVH